MTRQEKGYFDRVLLGEARNESDDLNKRNAL